ncbi:predicted protein [Naegleria gruberi]|uniref:Predicted protein n=1 Tax=Naegleria gruberi TaxID=5762 RepID=D2VW29_NAEGR|nr:uncharacterized protein NAEGRDRAFT_52713 [Naegleria gruberi]EFC39007.1 predicted protein [Naegleria gruberi]|eukprot:XP_002671751.1 predicted protein [Naegleria gruberi strain NEG-M]
MDNLSTDSQSKTSSEEIIAIPDDDKQEDEHVDIEFITYRHTALCPIYYPLIYRQNFSKRNYEDKDHDDDDVALQVTLEIVEEEDHNHHHQDEESSTSESKHSVHEGSEDEKHRDQKSDQADDCIKPLSIYAHTTEIVDNHHSRIIYSWGGRDHDGIEFQRYDILEKKWLPPIGMKESDDSPPNALYYHSLNYNPVNNSFYIIGGIRNDDSTPENDLTIYNLDTNEWKYFPFEEEAVNNPAPGIYGHVSVYRSFNNTIVLFGGYSDEWISKDLYVFDCETETWVEKIVPNIPIESRSFSTAVYNPSNDSMVIYAGELNIDVPVLTCDLVIFHFKTNSWTVVKFEETKICPVPQPIYGNTICLIDQRFLLSLGGCEQSNRIPKNDCYVFDLKRNEWSVCIQLGVAAGRLLCSSLVHDATGSGLYFYGGKTEEDVSTDSIIHVRYRFAGEFFFVEKIFQKLKNNQLCDIGILISDE